MAITKDQLISDLAEACDLQKSDVRALLDQLGEIVADALENDGEISLPGIGKLFFAVFKLHMGNRNHHINGFPNQFLYITGSIGIFLRQ